MAGLDPAIHHLRKTLVKSDGYAGLCLAEGGFGPAGGSSPRMTEWVLCNYEIVARLRRSTLVFRI
jgi:hypothetical protein